MPRPLVHLNFMKLGKQNKVYVYHTDIGEEFPEFGYQKDTILPALLDTVDSEIFAIILFLRSALKDLLVM